MKSHVIKDDKSQVLSVLNIMYRDKTIEKLKFIDKGFSNDKKWIVKFANETELFLKVCPIKDAEHKQKEFTYMTYYYESDVPVPQPISFTIFKELECCVQVFECVQGEDAEISLPNLEEDKQYDIGVEAGKILKKIHQYIDQNPAQTWEEYRWGKHERYLRMFEEMMESNSIPHTFNMEPIFKFIESHKYLLKNRPVAFLHDDYHPVNLMTDKGEFRAVIDFDRFEWGDPHHDFYKTALFTRNVSEAFARGQIDGYTAGAPSDEFWKRYSLYAAMLIIPDIVWAVRFGGDQPQQSIIRLNQVLEDHDYFTRYVPKWYRNN